MSAPKTKFFKSGAWTSFEKLHPSGMYLVQVYRPSGDLYDKIRCDNYSDACAYLRAFNKVAKNADFSRLNQA